MVKARTWFSLFIMGVVTVAATASCGSDEGTGGAAGGGVIGDGGSSGAGRGGSVGRAGSSSAGTPSSGGADANTPISMLGASCTTDKQCGDGMLCLTASSTEIRGGGPAGGMCTLACTASTDCTAVEPSSRCFDLGNAGEPKLYCLSGCVQGGDGSTAANKCQGRGDFACEDFRRLQADPPAPFCFPLCRSDLECGANLYCNKDTGVCSKTKQIGDPVGTACTPATTNVPGSDNCLGVCLRTSDDGVTPAKGVCAEWCAGLLDCQYTGDKPGGVCLGLAATSGLLDLGYCLPTCSCTAGCPFPGDKCRGWAATENEQSFAQDLGAPGLCFSDTVGSVELTACMNGEGEGGAGGEPGVTPGGEAGASGASGSAG